MKKQLATGLLIASVLLPASALAEHGADDQVGASVGIEASLNSNRGGKSVEVESHASATGTTQSDNRRGASKPEDTGNATSSAKRATNNKPATAGKPTTTRATTSNATSSDNKPAWGQKGGLVGFLKSMLGMSGSSTTDLRAQLGASSTASTTGAQGIGFFARLFSIFGFGK